MMKYVELTGWGNNKKHLIPLKQISYITFEPNLTCIGLGNGTSVNVIEDEFHIKEMLSFHNVSLVNEEQIRTLYSGFEEDELPF